MMTALEEALPEYRWQLAWRSIVSAASIFGLGFLARTLLQEPSKLQGLPDWLLAAAIASSATVVICYAAILGFEKGERLSSNTLKKLTKIKTSYMLDMLKRFGKHEASRKELEARIALTLAKSPLAESWKLLDEEAR